MNELSPAELDVLRYAALGLTVKATGHARWTSPQTVRKQRTTILVKLGAANMTQAVYIAVCRGILPKDLN